MVPLPIKVSNIRSVMLWSLALIVTLASVFLQRRTGPTHTFRSNFESDGVIWQYTIKRNPECGTPLRVSIPGPADAHAVLIWREYPTNRPWKSRPMLFLENRYEEGIPSQPPAGKVEFFIRLDRNDGQTTLIPGQNQTIIARFKNPVPAWALIPHIILMFAGLLLSNRVALSALSFGPVSGRLVWITFIFLFSGALIFGPVVQKYAFGSFWTGWPVGDDLTDNKSLIAILAWLIPVLRVLRKRDCRTGALIASIVTMSIFLIPHSLMGSEYDYAADNTVTTESQAGE
jgi:hypothetical protein